MTDMPTGAITRSRAKAMQVKVNSLLSLHQFNLSMDGLLPQADTLCVLRYEPNVNRSVDKEAKEAKEGGGPGEDDEQAADQEEAQVKKAHGEKQSREEVPGKSDTTGLGAVLPANYRPTSGNALC